MTLIPKENKPGQRAEQLAARLYDLMAAPIRWQLVQTAFAEHLFDHLRAPTGAEAIADKLGLDVRRTELVLDALTAMGLIEKKAGKYQIPPAYTGLLCTDGAQSLSPLMTWLPKLRHGGLDQLPDVLHGGDGGLPLLDLSDPAHWQKSVSSLRSFHRALALPVMLEILEHLPEWPVAKRFLDLGAGSEVLCSALAKRRSDLNISLFDLPPSAAILAEHLKQSGESRVQVLAGDYNRDTLGGPYDVIWCGMTFYYAAPDLASLLRRIRMVLSPGGVLISFHEGVLGERTVPEAHVVGRLMPALRGTDVSFAAGDIAEAMAQAGFTNIESRNQPTPFGDMRLDFARL